MLKKLSIGGKCARDSPMILPNSDIINKFLRNHPMLARLYIRPGIPQLELTDTTHLRAVDMDQVLDIQRFRPGHTLHFEYLATVDLSGLDRDQNLSVLSQMPSLRELVVKCDVLSSAIQDGLMEAIPLIEKLRFVGYHEDHGFLSSEISDEHGVCTLYTVLWP
jgi:hypothetical protein